MLADGCPKTAVAKTLEVGVCAVRAWEKRWLAGGGVKSLRHRNEGGAGRRAAAPSAALAEFPVRLPAALRGVRSGRGRPAGASLGIEAWVRDAIALGLAPPGCRLPSVEWFAKRFGVAKGTVASAFDDLACDRFVRIVPKSGAYVPAKPPFSGRFLMVLMRFEDGLQREGVDRALADAARGQTERRGVEWTILQGMPADPSGHAALVAKIASQRWCGVFLRTSPAEMMPGWEWLAMDRVAVSGMLSPATFLGRYVVTLKDYRACPDANKYSGTFATVFGTIRNAGRRRALVLADYNPYIAEGRDAELIAEAARFGIAVPEGCLQFLGAHSPDQVRMTLAAAVRVARQERIDSVAIMQDNFAASVCDAIARYFGREEAARLFIAAYGNRPALPETCLPVVWHGFDLVPTLDSFVDWCNAIHAGEKDPPRPLLAMF